MKNNQGLGSRKKSEHVREVSHRLHRDLKPSVILAAIWRSTKSWTEASSAVYEKFVRLAAFAQPPALHAFGKRRVSCSTGQPRPQVNFRSRVKLREELFSKASNTFPIPVWRCPGAGNEHASCSESWALSSSLHLENSCGSVRLAGTIRCSNWSAKS